MLSSFVSAFRKKRGLLLTVIGTAALGTVLQAQVVITGAPTVGSSNPVSAEPTVVRPPTTPCVVPLFNELEFNDYNERTFSYTPPAGCAGPYAKVVFSADITVTAGVQYDRSAQVYINNVTIYRGTTAEPGTGFSPSWHVERDVTDLSAALTTASTGIANIQNIVNSTYTGIIYANAELDFYPTSSAVPAAVVPDAVIPIYENDPSNYYETSSPLTEAITFPTNTSQVYLDLTSQCDEFWWLSTPDPNVAPYVNGVDATAFREMDVTIDGTPAGIAPQHPYLFTGGIDPYLWIPITGPQTLNLKPYRVNLTPFAGLLSDGNPHTFVVTDINTLDTGSGGSLVNGNLLVYLDHTSTGNTGSVTTDTLTANPATTVNVINDIDGNGIGEATVTESLSRSFTIIGTVTNSQQVTTTTTVTETVDFSNQQNVVSSDSGEFLTDLLTSTVDSTVTTATPTVTTTTVENYSSNPLKLFLTFNENDDGSEAETTTLDLTDQYKTVGAGSYQANAVEEVNSTDTQYIDPNGNFSTFGQASTGTYISSDTNGTNYSNVLTAANNVLTGVETGSSSSAVTVFIAASTTTVAQGAAVTLTANVTPQDSLLVPGGFVTFYANAASSSPIALGTVPVTASVATISVSTLPVGVNLITATYSGDSSFAAQTGVNTLTVTVTAVTGAFTLGALSPAASLSLVEGTSGVLSLPIAANVSFAGTVTFACTGMPAETSCVVNPATVTLAPNGTSLVSVVVTTTAPNSTSQAENRMPGLKKGLEAFSGISLAGLFLLLMPRRRSRTLKLLSMVVLLGMGLAAATGLSGCSNAGSVVLSPPFPGTPVGSTTLTVTATSGTLSQSTTFTLNVTN